MSTMYYGEIKETVYVEIFINGKSIGVYAEEEARKMFKEVERNG